ncbi:carboxypeptidase regulatory-like domain-containing protein [Nocardiopsis nanhaiensis]
MKNAPDNVDDPTGRSAALAAFDRSFDGAVLARTVSDALPYPPHAAHRARDGAPPRTLRFDMADVRLDIQIHPHGAHRWLCGLVSGEFDHVDILVRRPTDSLRLFVAVDGRFQTADLSTGPLSLTVERPGYPVAVTDWFTV